MTNRAFQPWWRRPAFAFAGSVVLTAAGTGLLIIARRPMGALAFGGCNTLALLLFAVSWDTMAWVVRSQSVAAAAASWLAAVAFSAGVVALYVLDYSTAATVVLSGVTLLYVLSAWVVVRVGPDPPSSGGSDNQ